MKATFDIPDDLYRSVKARSALEGRALRSVAVELFQKWLSAPHPRAESGPDTLTDAELERFPWLALARPYVRAGMSHDIEEMKDSIASAWGEEAASKLRSAGEKE